MLSPMTRRQWIGTTLGSIASASLARVAWAAESEEKSKFREIAPWSLYSFDNGLNGPDVPTVEAKAALLKKLGYAGMTDHYSLHRLPEVLTQLDKQGLEFASLYVVPKVEDPIDLKLKEAVELLKGRRARIEIGFTSKQFKSSDPAADEKAIEILKQVADWCGDTGPIISIYHHIGFWTDRVDDGIRLAQKMANKNVGTNFNLFHWKAASDRKPAAGATAPAQKPLEQLVTEALPHLKLVTINGLDTKNKNQIVSLADGDYDVAGWLTHFKKAGYNGPVGLQCYSIKGSSEEHLTKSMTKWQEIRKQVIA